MKTIVMIGTMDTKSDQILFVKEIIEKSGHHPLLIDIGTRYPSPVSTEVACDEVAKLAGTSIEAIRGMKQGQAIISPMTEGATKKAQELLEEGRLDGIVSLGGAGTTSIATSVMRSLPYGVPKVMISSAAGIPAYAASFFGTGDIMIMNTIVDIAGLNAMLKNALSRGAAAICSMVSTVRYNSLSELLSGSGKPFIAMTEDGSCELCGSYVRKNLEKRGYDVITFHAQGLGDRAMEELIGKGFFDGVVDIAVIGVSDELWQGNRPGGPDRLEMAGRRGIPLVMTPNGLNHTGAGPTRRNSEKYASRSRIYKFDELRVATRYNEEELKINGRTVAEKLNKARGPVKVFVPLKGFSSWDVEGSILYAPEEDMILIDEMKRHLKPEIEVVEIDANLEEERFAKAVVEGFDKAYKSFAQSREAPTGKPD